MRLSMKFKCIELIVKYIVAPVLTPVLWASDGIYYVLFRWYDVRLDRMGQKKLASELEEAAPFLFAQYGAVFVPNVGIPIPAPFDYAAVTVDCGVLLLRVIRGRGELKVELARSTSSSTWDGLELVLTVLRGETECHPSTLYDLPMASRLLAANIDSIFSRFALDPDGSVSQRLEKLRKAYG